MKTGKTIKSKIKEVKKTEKKAVSALKTKAAAVKKAEKKAVTAVKKTAKTAASALKTKAVAVKKAEKKAVTAVKKTAKTAASAAKKTVKKVKNKVVKIEKAVTDLKKQSAAKAKEQGSASDRLTPQEIKEIEKHLLEMREEVQKRIRTKKEHEMPETEVGDEADVASQSLDKEVLFELNGNAQALLDQIESALRRISKGIYGTCEYCRCQIPKKRILALPFARYCIRCQTSNEGIKR
ncbi:TraR/DksA family transcriptional regulator [Candidatus Proelusimicrobium excrementi]|uniref:TraR/DksA family transcriptional regulator n=1 Tax=Candidatus Proelusimicrobium excrementi TaxID=3416222 RepID=UPI003CBD6E67|nr:TraR/DksA C4-type zinc finger protein [Elusimicrobiaceae bacterium]